MSQGHMERLTSVDASFLSNETTSSHMHIGAVLVFEGPPPEYDDLLRHIEARLHLVPRYRQRLAFPPAQSGRPFWIDDASFNLEYHVRHSALPSPGSEEQLRSKTARLFSQQLDRSKPLWEMWLVQGLSRNRFALISKAHHALIDGVAGVDIGTVLFDVKPVPEPAELEHTWVPEPEPSAAELAARGAGAVAQAPLDILRRVGSAVEHPRRAAGRLSESLEAVGEVGWALANSAPDVPLNTEIGAYRRFEWVRTDLNRFKEIKQRLGGTVNDVVLAVVTGALRQWLIGRGLRVDGLELRALVPVSIRAEDEKGQPGNRIAAMRGPLPVYIEDPIARLEAVKQAMEGVKQSKQALGAEVISRFNDFAPPTLLAQASRLNFSTRLFNMIVTNIPGPQIPLYVLGRELEDVFPIAFLPRDHAMALAIMSYNGGINFGLLGCYDAMPDLGLVADLLERSIGELAEAASELTGETATA